MRRLTKNKKTPYILLAIAFILVSIFLLNGGHWNNVMDYPTVYSPLGNLNWTQVLISLFIGIVIGFFVAKRKR